MRLPLPLKKLLKWPLLWLLRLLESDVERWKREDKPGKRWRDVDGLVVMLCLFLAACPAPDPQPSPTPTPAPERPPAAIEPSSFPLRVE